MSALLRKKRTSEPGAARGTTIAAGEGWQVVDIVCTSGPGDRPFEERHARSSFSLVLSGTFVYRGDFGASLMSPGTVMLATAGQGFECSHQHGEGDRCLSFQFAPEQFERLAHDAGASDATFRCDRLPPLRALAPLTARAQVATTEDAFEEVAFEFAGVILALAGRARSDAPTAPRDPAPIARALREMEARCTEPQPLADLARVAGLSPYHFLRSFKRATGVTPHQWVLRARLREAARRLATTRVPITEIALDVGFEDLSNFIRTFRAEFGVSPGAYRAAAR